MSTVICPRPELQTPERTLTMKKSSQAQPVLPRGRAVVGIDIGKGKHAATALSPQGEVIAQLASFPNTRQGVDQQERRKCSGNLSRRWARRGFTCVCELSSMLRQSRFSDSYLISWTGKAGCALDMAALKTACGRGRNQQLPDVRRAQQFADETPLMGRWAERVSTWFAQIDCSSESRNASTHTQRRGRSRRNPPVISLTISNVEIGVLAAAAKNPAMPTITKTCRLRHQGRPKLMESQSQGAATASADDHRGTGRRRQIRRCRSGWSSIFCPAR